MPAGDKYLAVLAGIPHSAFSGSNSLVAEDSHLRQAVSTGNTRGNESGPSHGKSGGRKESAGHGKNNAREDPVAGSSDWSGQPPTLTARAMAVAAIQGISTAFLDSVVKNDATAREWLRKDANRWLRDTGVLSRK